MAVAGETSRPGRARDARSLYWLPVILVGAGVLAYAGLAGVAWWIDARVHESARRAMREFPGDEVESLIALVQADGYPLAERNRAVYALGQLGDARAVPVLARFYTGAQCDHDRFLCQRELRKAMDLCRQGGRPGRWLPFFPRARPHAI